MQQNPYSITLSASTSSAAATRRMGSERFSRKGDYGTSGRQCRHHSGLIPASLITLAHFWVSLNTKRLR
jgi:hypothetical protein